MQCTLDHGQTIIPLVGGGGLYFTLKNMYQPLKNHSKLHREMLLIYQPLFEVWIKYTEIY